MKKNTNTQDKSTPYRTMSYKKIAAPVAIKGEPKATKIQGKGDLRGGKK